MNDVIKILKKSKRVAIIAHISPDPDCIGSMTTLSSILKRMGKEASIYVDTKTIPEYFSCFDLPECVCGELNPNDFDTLVVVDTSSFRQLGKYGPIYKEFNNTVLIDHHKVGDLQANASFTNSNSTSCSEIIFDLAIKMGIKLNKKEATYLFAGLIGDTNCFQNDNINANTFETAAKLCKLGADTKDVIFQIFKHTTNKDITLKKLAYENMVCSDGVGYFIFTRKMQKEVGTDDLGNIVNEILNNEDNKIAFAIKQKEKNVYTVSLRCKYEFDVSKIATRFGGGGHKQASGIMFVGSPQKHLKQILDACYEQIGIMNNG
ncbi:MAG: bifunctional oligoribonuclease/PAP phosphatase NrnA [Clostridia bacterium]|nr:bifunctional oligoribonuclease/PAP phosphatase NrnA [Clostridia bacterium]